MIKDWDAGVSHLADSDAAWKKLIREVGDQRLRVDRRSTPYESLVASVVYQQLTGKAAATILGRVKDLFGGEIPDPSDLVAVKDARLRAAGLSGAKTLALKDIAQKTLDGIVPGRREASRLSNEEIIERLTQIRGVGRWTVEMFLIFTLGRPDVWPVTDYGVRKGFAMLYRRRELPTPHALDRAGEKWRPYRSVAAWYLWRAVDVASAEKKAKKSAGE